MTTKNFFYIVICIAVLLLIFGSWKFLTGFALAGAIFWYFGETRVKEAVKNAYDTTKGMVDNLQETIIPQDEECVTAVRSSFITSAGIIGLYQIVIVADGKSYLLQPCNISQIPEELGAGRVITIKTHCVWNGIKPVKKQVIIAKGKTYDVV